MLLPENLNELISFDSNTGRVSSREGKHCEFKEIFDKTQIAKYSKSLSAFANASGGKIIFGVSDSPRLIVGVDPSSLLDEAEITTHLSVHFDPEIPFEAKEYHCNNLTVYVLAVSTSTRRPVICKRGKNIEYKADSKTKTREILAEGAIYYRYSAKSERVKFTELQAIIEDREQKKIQTIIETLKLAEKVGFDRVGFVDAKEYGQQGNATDLYVTEEAAKSLNFIDKGRFVEMADHGSPAYYVMGKVNLRQVIIGELPDEDKNLPSEVAVEILPTVKAKFGAHVLLSASQVGKILSEFGLLEMPYFQEDTKISRKYITREGISALQKIN